MSPYFPIIYSILVSDGEEFSKRRPEVNERNVFTVSTLAHSSAKQIWWKLDGNRDMKYLSMAQTRGKAMHEFIQHRLPHCAVEYKMTYQTERYKILGDIDAVDFQKRIIIEIKTTKDNTIEEGRLREYLLQLGGYQKMLKLETGLDFSGFVYVLSNTGLMEYESTVFDVENSWKILIERAEETYLKLYGVSEK